MTLLMPNQYPRIGVGVIFLRKHKVLLGKRKGPRDPGVYGLPGGYLENNETYEECARREIKEETGLVDLSLFPIYFISEWSNNTHYSDIIFYAEYRNGEPTVKESDRVERWDWFDLLDLPSPLFKPSESALNRFIKNYNFHKIALFFKRWMPGKVTRIMYYDGKKFH